MAYFIDEQKLIEENVFKFENRINSQVSRFLDKNPIFVTYYHININETTVDDGFRDIESILGNRSPLRFQKIKNFPMYGIEQIVTAIQDNDEGLNTGYTGDAVILPNTIKPLQNDFFMINHLKDLFLFRITEVQYDTIRPDNFYKIEFRFEYLDKYMVDNLNNQVEDSFSCILQNIGTENNCIIKEDCLERINDIDILYNDMVSTYKAIFYDERYNCFLGTSDDGFKLYDPFQSMFFNNHNLLNKKQDYSTIVLTDGFSDNKRKIKYERSIYRFFERRDIKKINEFQYILVSGISKKDSEFYRWGDESIKILDIPLIGTAKYTNKSYSLFPQEIVKIFTYNAPTESKYIELMQKFIRDLNISIYDIPLDLNDELLKLDANEEVFFFTPILMYIIQTTVNKFIEEKK